MTYIAAMMVNERLRAVMRRAADGLDPPGLDEDGCSFGSFGF
jgi:hypothetical protein